MLKAYKYRIYPKHNQKVLFNKYFGCTRFVYNWALETKTKYYHKNKKGISCFEIMNQLVQLKKDKETRWLSDVHSQSLQQSIISLDKAFTSFFKKNTQFPKFKSKHNKQSFQYPQNVKVDFHNSTVKLPKIGEVKTVFSREFKGKN